MKKQEKEMYLQNAVFALNMLRKAHYHDCDWTTDGKMERIALKEKIYSNLEKANLSFLDIGTNETVLERLVRAPSEVISKETQKREEKVRWIYLITVSVKNI